MGADGGGKEKGAVKDNFKVVASSKILGPPEALVLEIKTDSG